MGSAEMKKFKKKMESANQNVADSRESMFQQQQKLKSEVTEMRQDTQRMVSVINSAPAIIHDINIQFEQATKLRGKDIAFLFGAAALQTARWIILPSLDFDFKKIPAEERMTAQEGGRFEKAGVQELLYKSGYSNADIAEMSRNHFRTYGWEELLIAPVPYDAMHGSARIEITDLSPVGTELYSKNHHTATWGHDPVWGWIFGPLNITARMITFRNFQTFHVMQIGQTAEQKITYATSPGHMIEKSLANWSEDSRRLFASVAKQGLHLQSDKYTKTGLPIPFLSTETTQHLLMNGWNSYEVERLFGKLAKNLGIVGTQYILAGIIDSLVSALHLLCYDSTRDGALGPYDVKTKKVVCYSNTLAEVANGLYIVLTGDYEKMDIGGYINLAKNLINNAEFQRKVKAEFLERELEKRLYGEEYYFMEANRDGI